jgi:hypothetical protein
LGFVGLGHFSDKDADDPRSLHPAAWQWSAGTSRSSSSSSSSRSSSSGSSSSSSSSGGRKVVHRAAFVPLAEGKKGCSCALLARVLPGEPCAARSWPVGAEFWASKAAVLARPLSFWRNALLESVGGPEVARFGSDNGSRASPAGYCFEALWPALLSGGNRNNTEAPWRGQPTQQQATAAAAGHPKSPLWAKYSQLSGKGIATAATGAGKRPEATPWVPAFRYIEELPTVSFEHRCQAAAGSVHSAPACGIQVLA